MLLDFANILLTFLKFLNTNKHLGLVVLRLQGMKVNMDNLKNVTVDTEKANPLS